MLNWIVGREHASEVRAAISLRPGDRNGLGARGIVAGTMIATIDGWRRAETLCAGDVVMTFDSGPQPLRSVSRRLCPGPRSAGGAAQPVIVLSPGVAGNRGTLRLLPGQPILLESDVAEDLYGDPFALMPARAITDLDGITKVLNDAPLICVSLGFAEEEIVYADGQALLHCEATGISAPETLEEAMFPPEPRYRILSLEEAHGLVDATLLDDDAMLGGALT